MLRSGFPLPLWLDVEAHTKPIEDAIEDVTFKGVEPATAARLLIDQLEQIQMPDEG